MELFKYIIQLTTINAHAFEWFNLYCRLQRYQHGLSNTAHVAAIAIYMYSVSEFSQYHLYTDTKSKDMKSISAVKDAVH
jgi:hypothetical protein